jgi:hypothetical protein
VLLDAAALQQHFVARRRVVEDRHGLSGGAGLRRPGVAALHLVNHHMQVRGGRPTRMRSRPRAAVRIADLIAPQAAPRGGANRGPNGRASVAGLAAAAALIHAG